MALLTEQIWANTVSLNDMVHIARADQGQSENGSSYKATIAQLIDAESCCLTSGEYIDSSDFINLYGQSGGLSLQIQNVFIFSGGPGPSNCINNFYVNNINPCLENINIQPTATNNRQTFFGKNSASSGFTVSHVIQTGTGGSFTFTKLGLNTQVINQYSSLQLKSFNQLSEIRFYDNLIGVVTGFRDVQQIITLSDSLQNLSTLFKVQTSDGTTVVMGSINNNDNLSGVFGEPSDTFLSTTGITKGLNIVSTDSVTNDSGYINFYLGGDWALLNGDPYIHIHGDNPTKGFMGVGRGNVNPTSLLDISAVGYTTNGYQQLRLRTSYQPPGQTDVTSSPIGAICWGVDGLYIKINPFVWRQFPMSAW